MLNIFKRNMVEVLSPMSGMVVPIEKVPDESFSKKTEGDGLAIEPIDGKVIAPFDGEIVSMYTTNNCIAIRADEGIELLIHVGIDTIDLDGKGFKRFVELNQKVKAGDVLIEADLNVIKNSGKSIISPIVVTNMGRVESIEKFDGILDGGKDVLMNVKVKKKK